MFDNCTKDVFQELQLEKDSVSEECVNTEAQMKDGDKGHIIVTSTDVKVNLQLHLLY